MKNKNKPKDNLKNFLEIKNFTDTTADLYFYGDIVSDYWGAWEEEDQYPMGIKNFLDDHQGKDLNIYINSGGGSVFGGMCIYNILKRHTGYKTVYIDGLCASIASVIALSGDKIVIPSNGYFMIHKPWQPLWGGYNAIDLRKLADDMDRIEEGIQNIYSENLQDGVNIETIIQMMAEETWLVGEEATKYFNIELIQPNESVAYTSDLLNSFKNTPTHLEKQNKKDDNIKNNHKLALQLDLLKLKEI